MSKTKLTSLLLLITCIGSAVAQPAETVLYYHTDHLGSVRMASDAQRRAVRTSDYLPFGEEVSPAPQNDKKFTGHYRDEETVLDYAGARYYSAPFGRFLSVDPARESVDPVNPQAWNRYSYGHNNTLIFVDPDGRSATLIGAASGFVIGGGTAWLQGKRGREAWAAAARGGLEGAMIGSVIDTGGASLGVLLTAGALSHTAGAYLERYISGKPSTVQDVAGDLVLGAIIPPIPGGPLRTVPLGFQSQAQFLTAAKRIQGALGSEVLLGLRGSSVTGIRYRTGEAVTAETFKDYDFFAVSSALVKKLGGRAALKRGYFHLGRGTANRVPQMGEALRQISKETGKPASVRVFTQEYFEKKVDVKKAILIR